MTDSAQQVWVVPSDPYDLAPLPALQDEGLGLIALYDRHKQGFGLFGQPFNAVYDTFDECRAAMIELRIQMLDASRAQSLHHAKVIEHLKFIPAVEFPDVVPEVSEAQQQQAEGQEEAQAEEVKPAQLKRPSRRSNASN